MTDENTCTPAHFLPCSNEELVVTIDYLLLEEEGQLSADNYTHIAPMFSLKRDNPVRTGAITHRPLWAGAYRCLPRDLDDPEVSVR